MTYKIIRFYSNGNKDVTQRGLTLDQAQAHCRDPETASSTATYPDGADWGLPVPDWFDGYGVDNGK